MSQKISTISLPLGLAQDAKKRGINISRTCANALENAIKKIDREEPEYE